MAASSRSHRAVWGLGLLVLVLAAGFGWQGWRARSGPDMVAVFRANNEGIGWMEWFKESPIPGGRDGFSRAVLAFEEVVALAPDWLPGRINLGIALLNTQDDAKLQRATALFRSILREQPRNPHAHFCLGIIAYYWNQPEEASVHFTAVTEIDPTDPHAWYYRGKTHPGSDQSPEALECFQKALQLNPHLHAARYSIAQHPEMLEHPERKQALLNEHKALEAAGWSDPCDIKYSEMGRYAEVIGRDPNAPRPAVGPLPWFDKSKTFQVTLAPGARWATAADFGEGPLADLRRAVRRRFGATLVLLDYNQDGKPDLFLLSAVVEKGQVRDLLLRNDGAGRFTDVTAEAGLADPRPSLGCCVADFDNDGYPDLLITGAGVQKLFRNNAKGRFEDRSDKAGLDRLNSVCLGCAAVDLDQDSDLDLVVAQYAETVENALKRLQGKAVKDRAGLVVLINTSEAPAVRPGDPPLPWKWRFERAKGPDALLVSGPLVGLALSDVDNDRDVDLLVLPDKEAPVAVLNDRLLRFHRAEGKIAAARAWNGALVLDLKHSGRSDLLLLGSGQTPKLLVNQAKPTDEDATRWYAPAPINSPPLKQAEAVDLDLDGWTDVVGLSEAGQPVLLHNDGTGRLVQRRETLGRDKDWPADLVAVAVADLDGDCYPDLLLWSEGSGLHLRRNLGNGNRALNLAVTGLREPGKHLHTNADAIGARIVAQTGPLWTGLENTTLAAGLGQSRLPLLLGLGRAARADVVRVAWPDGIPQAELNISTCDRFRYVEINRKGVSCPVLLAWNGTRFGYVTDFLGAGSMGELGPDGTTRPPRPEESVKIEPGQLVPRDGFYQIKIAEPLDEILYLDRLQLVVLDHPADVSVYPDERFVTKGPQPSQDLLAFREQIFPMRARDHHGRDVTATLRHRDKKMVDDFARRAWLGYAEEHWVELDFGDRLARLDPKQRLFLCLAGWIDYPYPESIFAATQAGVPMQPPVLERQDADGKWHVVDEIGFPAGLPRMMTCEVTGRVGPGTGKLRIRTNLQVFWDQIYLAPLAETITEKTPGLARATTLEVSQATLAYRGFIQQTSPDGQLVEYDDERTEMVAVSPWQGRFTRFGDVTEPLRQADDCFVVCGPGEEITVRFDARKLPPLPVGWTRSFVLRTWGYCKDSSPFTESGGVVESLPFRAMTRYPYGPAERYPDDALHKDYLRRYQTRRLGGQDRSRPMRHNPPGESR